MQHLQGGDWVRRPKDFHTGEPDGQSLVHLGESPPGQPQWWRLCEITSSALATGNATTAQYNALEGS